jgi:LmbE family N-acetylglucosaminyl deacetylase
VKRRLCLLLTVLAASVVVVAQEETVVIAVDCSYSLTLPHDSISRGEALLDAALEYLASRAPETSYVLIVSETAGSISVDLSYPSTSSAVVQALPCLTPWGTTDIGSLLDYALRYAALVGGPAEVLLITDGEDRRLLESEPRTSEPDKTRTISTILFDSGLPSCAADRLARLAVAHGGDVVAVGPGADRIREVVAAAGRLPAIDTAEEASTPIPTGTPTENRRGFLAFLSAWLRYSRYLFLACVVAGLFAALRAAYGWRRRVEKVRLHNARPPETTLFVQSPTGRTEHTVSAYPVIIGGPQVPLEGEAGSVQLTSADDGLRLSSTIPVKVNGLEKRDATLREGSLLRVGAHRITIRRIRPVRQVRPPRARHTYYVVAPGIAAVAALCAFLLLPSVTRAAAARRQSGPRLSALVADGPSPAHSTGPLFTAPRVTLPDVAAPGSYLPDLDVDFLAIHAHPDDESLDFGLAISRLVRSGMTGAMVILTDGEAGIDQYPERPTGPGYPPYDIGAEELGRVRVEEAGLALGTLGVGTYFRLGLQNHPYGSVSDQLPIATVMEHWGGRAAVVAQLASVIEHCHPELLLSPDGPAGPYEHFEHEATGILVAEALSRLETSGRSPVALHLACVDPLQTSGYESLIAVPAWDLVSDPDLRDRMTQIDALSQHLTQRDASAIGVETRMGLPFEYYRIASGRSAGDPGRGNEFLRILGVGADDY